MAAAVVVLVALATALAEPHRVDLVVENPTAYPVSVEARPNAGVTAATVEVSRDDLATSAVVVPTRVEGVFRDAGLVPPPL